MGRAAVPRKIDVLHLAAGALVSGRLEKSASSTAPVYTVSRSVAGSIVAVDPVVREHVGRGDVGDAEDLVVSAFFGAPTAMGSSFGSVDVAGFIAVERNDLRIAADCGRDRRRSGVVPAPL